MPADPDEAGSPPPPPPDPPPAPLYGLDRPAVDPDDPSKLLLPIDR